MGNKEIRKFICIRCPRGCEITAHIDDCLIEKIKGSFCKLGREYVETEITDPRRIVTSTVKVKNGDYLLAPVWTSKAIPKGKIFDLMKILSQIELEAPVKINKVVIKNLFGLGVNVLASGKVDRV